MNRLPRNYTLLTDEYELTMSETYFKCGKKEEKAVFDVFFRRVPTNGGYAIMAALIRLLNILIISILGKMKLSI